MLFGDEAEVEAYRAELCQKYKKKSGTPFVNLLSGCLANMELCQCQCLLTVDVMTRKLVQVMCIMFDG